MKYKKSFSGWTVQYSNLNESWFSRRVPLKFKEAMIEGIVTVDEKAAVKGTIPIQPY